MSKAEHDPHTGYLTTGHEWNGITELNTPVPRPVYVFLISAALFAIGYWILMPAWPTGVSYTKGLLGIDQKQVVAASLREAEQERSAWTKRIESESYAAILRDPVLMGAVRQTGRTLFGDNCAACHGAAAKGNKGFPNLTSGAWLWGGTPDAIAETIRVGINSTHPKTRVAQMPAFGRDQILKSADIEDVLAYLSSLGPASVAASRTGDVAKGKVVFIDTCAVCHGDDARGKQDVGSPDLTDAFWIYGGDAHSVYDSIWWGRQGHMPTWEGRLTSLERRILTLYVTDLQGKR